MDSFTAALSRLDPAKRALLDLSLRRGMLPGEIAGLLGLDADSVVAAREQALEQLAGELELDDRTQLDPLRARLAELPPEAWTPGLAPPMEREPPRRKRRLPLLLALLALAVIALVVVLSSGDDKEKVTPAATTTTPTTTARTTRTTPAGTESEPGTHQARPTRLVTIGRKGPRGTAMLTQGGKRLVVHAGGLATGTYQVWLYNSVIEAKSLGAARGTKLDLDLHLPPSANHYRAIDVSREPHDGNRNHSGQSVLRVSLAKLAGG